MTPLLTWTWNDRIRKLRQEVGMRQAEFAELIGVKEGTYAAWERDSHPRDVISTSQAIEAAVECPGVCVWLLVGEPAPALTGLLARESGWIYESDPRNPSLLDFLADITKAEVN